MHKLMYCIPNNLNYKRKKIMMTLISGGKYKAQQMQEARGWIVDYSCRYRPQNSRELTDEEVVQVVNRHYFGGWKQFGKDIERGFTAD